MRGPRTLLGRGVRLLGSVKPVPWRELYARHTTIREGVVTGLIGAAAVALWFLIVDALAGRLFFTPAALGSALFLGASEPAAVQVTTGIVLSYTLLHVAAFVLTGLVAAGIVAAAERYPEAVLLGAVLLFVTFETFSIGMLAIVAVWLVDALSWWNVAAANLIAAVAMGAYLYHRHPALVRHVRSRNLEEDLASRRAVSRHPAPAAR